MADPHPLYFVTAVVVLGLVAWVAVVLSRPAKGPSAGGEGTKSGEGKPAEPTAKG